MSGIRSHKKITLFIVAGVLVLLNLWKWQFSANVESAVIAASGSSQLEALLTINNARVNSDLGLAVNRNIFEAKRLAVSEKSVMVVKKVITAESESPPQKSEEELIREAVLLELSEYKCVGISVRNGVIQAFITRGDQNFVVPKGAHVGGRFVVTNIDMEQVTLVDDATGIVGIIKLAGAK